MTRPDTHVGALLRHWRGRRGMSQLDLAIAADVSSRHVSFVETGRSQPSAEMVLRLAAALEVPLRQTNVLLRAAGHPARFEDTGALPPAVAATLQTMKEHHEPYPLIVLDRAYDVLDLNDAAARLLSGVLSSVLPGGLATTADADAPDQQRLNLARLTLDPALGGQIVLNHDAVARDLLWRVQRELLTDPDDERLRTVAEDLLATPGIPEDWRRPDPTAPSDPTLDLHLRVGEEVWSFRIVLSALLAPLEVALDELRIEQWFPADEVTRRGCQALAGH
ncbi:helix-turn-helix transcriptional regulator [Nocardioidaceae bacterium]|nr:helix-turn-helix transcriptional regulator [Nocardioidaceae bacterium]